MNTAKLNKRRMIAAIATYLGFSPDNLAGLTPFQIEQVADQFNRIIEKDEGLMEKLDSDERIGERDVQIGVAEGAIDDGVEFFRIVGQKDERTCEDCAKWQGQTVATHRNYQGYPLVQDFINEHGFHPNCRCSLQKLDVEEIPRKPPNPRARNSECDSPLCFN